MAYFDCIVGGSGKGNTLVVTCADDLAGATITCTNGTKTYRKTCPSTAPYEVTFYGLMAGTWTVSATVSGNTYTTTVVITDYEAELGGFNWKTWVDLSENYTSSDFTDLDDLLSDETAIRELMTIHACVDYLADIATTSADVETIIGNDLCAKWINNRDYALDTLYANTIIADYMDTADKYFYGEWVITDNTTTPPTWGAKGNVPIMTANNAPYGEASATSQYNATNAPYMAFDGSDSTTWASSSNTNQRLVYKFTNPVNVRFVEFVNRLSTPTQIIKDYKIQYSDDGSAWHDAVDETLTNQQVEVTTTNISDKGYHLYWGLLAINDYGSTNISVISLQFYGRELSVSVPVMATNTTPYGEASAESYNENAYKAFNGMPTSSANSGWFPDSNKQSWFGYKFNSPCCAKMLILDLMGNLNSSRSFNVTVKASKDGTTYDTIKTFTASNNQGINYVDIDANDGYLYYALDSTWYSTQSYGFKAQFFGLDYSEKEFEEGTTKKWLYDHGLELETLTFDGSSSYKVLAENDGNDIHLKSSGGAAGVTSALAKVTIDLTSYSLVRCKVGNVLSTNDSGGRAFIIVVYTIGSTTDNKAVLQVFRGSSILPNNLGLDISSINGRYDLDILDSNNGGAESKVSEWWLE